MHTVCSIMVITNIPGAKYVTVPAKMTEKEQNHISSIITIVYTREY